MSLKVHLLASPVLALPLKQPHPPGEPERMKLGPSPLGGNLSKSGWVYQYQAFDLEGHPVKGLDGQPLHLAVKCFSGHPQAFPIEERATQLISQARTPIRHVPRFYGEARIPEKSKKNIIVMKHIDGWPIDRPGKNLPPNKARYVMTILFETLTDLAANGITHLDLKPDNIMITRRCEQIFIVGLGSALPVNQPGCHQGCTDYAPPDMDLHSFVTAHSWDIYSAGMTWAVLLGGQLGLRGNDIAKSPDIPAKDRDLITALLNPKAAERPDAAEVLSRLLNSPGTRAPNLRTPLKQAHPPSEPEIMKLGPNLLEIGAGRWGEVYRHQALDLEGRPVIGHDGRPLSLAVKRFPNSPHVFAIEDEATRLISRAGTPIRNVPKFYEEDRISEKSWQDIIVMEYIDGRDFARLGSMSPDKARYVMIKLFETLTDLAANGITHLDLKPDNIMIDRSGRIFIIDLGGSLPVNQAGSHRGCKDFAPSDIDLHSFVTAHSWDIYSAGMTWAVLLGGQLGLRGNDIVKSPDIPAKDRDLIAALLNLKAAERPGAAEVLSRLMNSPDTQTPNHLDWF